MSDRLTLVSDRSAAHAPEVVPPIAGAPTSVFVPQTRTVQQRPNPARWLAVKLRKVMVDERGAVTAEYAIVIVAAVAFAGLLVAIIRSDAIRQTLVTLVENALGTGG